MLVLFAGLAAANLLCIRRGEASRYHKPPESGATDEYVRSLGDRAEDFLVKKLSDPKEERHHIGLIRQLERFARLDKDDPKTTQALINFVEKQTRRDEIPISTLEAVARTVQFLAYRGGADGVKYVGAWLNGSKTASAHIRGDKDSLTQEWMKTSAVRGLAWSNRDDAQILRKKLRENLSSGDDGRRLKGLLDETDKEHSKVMEKGLDGAMSDWGMR